MIMGEPDNAGMAGGRSGLCWDRLTFARERRLRLSGATREQTREDWILISF
jgi:hypothetical protein